MKAFEFTHCILLGVNTILALFLGWLLTETRHRLADKNRWFNRKPFNCRPCLTFHIGWILSGIVALCIKNIFFFTIEIPVMFLIWILLEIENRSKIDK